MNYINAVNKAHAEAHRETTLTEALVTSHHTALQRIEARAADPIWTPGERLHILLKGYAGLGGKITAEALAHKAQSTLVEAYESLQYHAWAMDYSDQDDPYFYPPAGAKLDE